MEDEEDDEADEDDEDDEGSEADDDSTVSEDYDTPMTVSINLQDTINYQLTTRWIQAPNGTWVRNMIVQPPAESHDGMKLLIQAAAADTIATAIGRAWRERR